MAKAIPQRRIFIEGVSPSVDHSRYPVKAVEGDTIAVGVDIFKDGHDTLKAAVLWQRSKLKESGFEKKAPTAASLKRGDWQKAPLTERENDRWIGEFQIDKMGPWCYTIAAWTDRFGSWRKELSKKAEAGQNVRSELLEGIALIEEYSLTAKGKDLTAIQNILKSLRDEEEEEKQVSIALSAELAELMDRNEPRDDITFCETVYPLWADRERARYGSWYEIFIRSQGNIPGKSGTFRDAEKRLRYFHDLGYNVLYLTPIHPIGFTHRKGANNSETCQDGEPGSPWAIGSKDGGHMAIHPELGTIDDFDSFIAKAAEYGIEIALDFAIQCSPDHPWVQEHPKWFSHRPDGTIKYAENPPKKYQDIYPINFDTSDREGLYNELLKVTLYWVKHGVKIFRVDNPHTKPISFWEWLIRRVQMKHPEVIFLAEAFTRPKRMKALAKIGFTQSYSYFTWRNEKAELEEYTSELFCTDVRNYMRPNFFANTPDILHAYLQNGGRPAFLVRLILAGTLSPTYGIYNGFELCDHRPVRPGSEEYLDSEKYQFKTWDWDSPGNIKETVSTFNRIRVENPALHLADNLQIVESSNSQIIAYTKVTPDRKNILLIVVNLDPYHSQEGMVALPREFFHGGDHDSYRVTDLLSDQTYTWTGPWNYVRLNPFAMPAHILRVEV